MFAAIPPAKLLLAPGPANALLPYSAYFTLALGSALALFLYPHAMTGVLSASSRGAISRNAALLPAYSFLLALIALLGFMALAVGVDKAPAIRRLCQGLSAQFLGAGAVSRGVSIMVRRRRLRRDRDRRAGAGRDHVDRRRQSVDPQHLQGVHQPDLHPGAGIADGKARLAGRQVRRAGVHRLDPAAIRDQPAALGGVWIIQTLPAVIIGLYTRWFHQKALMLGWLVGIVVGTTLAAAQGFTPIYPLPIGGYLLPSYTALATLVLNFDRSLSY